MSRHAAAEVCPSATVRRLLLHGVQYEADGAPAREPYVLMGQRVHAVELRASEYWPAGHDVQRAAPDAAEKVPSGHGVTTPPSSLLA